MEASGDLCRGLFSRALTGVFAFDEAMWAEYIRFLSVSGTFAQAPHAMLDVIRRAVDHCPWSGALWSRYILSAEEARLPFHDIEQIKHKATSHPDLYKNGLSALLDIYAGWCGFLKRTAMDLNASDEAVDVADMGLRTALESVEEARRRYAPEYRGDPAFRLERIYIQYLTEKKQCVDDARKQWYKLAENQLYGDSYDFWLHYYLWEMMVFASNGKDRSPTPSTAAVGLRVPLVATAVLGRAVKRKNLDWPERIMEVYLQHCNDYELPSTVRNATDTVAEIRKEVKKRRELEQQQAAELYAAQYPQAQLADPATEESLSASKRKRGDGEEADTTAETANKRQKNHGGEDSRSVEGGHAPKRDRENTSVLVMNIPAAVTQTKIRQYFREYGHINSIATVTDADGDTQTVFLEFRTPEDAQSALLRDGKYMGDAQIAVQPGTDLTVYATNYPPTFGPDDIRKLFKGCGDIISIRMPSLKGNVRRRFCYITFKNLEASTRATQKDGMTFEGGFKLNAMFSDPTRAKKREGAVEEGRELHITDLDTAASENDLKTVFSKFGNVLRVSIPRNKAGKTHGTAYVELETKAQAESAASELNKTKYRNTIMTVRVSMPMTFKRSAAVANDRALTPAVSEKDNEGDENMPDLNGGADSDSAPKGSSHEELAARTIALLDIPDTVNDARLKAIVQPLGGFKSLVLQPSHGGARVEFDDPASAGHASLQLDGYVLDGRKLRTGTLDELRHAKGEVRTDMIQYGVGRKDNKAKAGGSSTKFAPSTVKRPVLGKGGAKRGLGFVSKSTGAVSKTNGVTPSENTAEQSKPMRSNADFKAMFLKSDTTSKSDVVAEETGSKEKSEGSV
jgi:RNA recognition motif-containing protein